MSKTSGRWSDEVLREKTTVQLWCELGIHRGYLGKREFEATRTEGRLNSTYWQQPQDYYYLGRDDIVGMCSVDSRMVLHTSALPKNLPWFHDIFSLNPNLPMQGPVFPERTTIMAIELNKPVAKRALELHSGRGGGQAKPKFRLKQKFIAKQDRPDAGRTLLYHAESDSYLVLTDPDDVAQQLEQGLDDVTGVAKHERGWERQQAKPKAKFKLKPKQQDLFNRPYKRPFILKGRGQ